MKLTFEQATLSVRLSVASRREWDEFAQQCHASFRSSHRGVRAWQLERHWIFRLRRFDLWLASPVSERKIGQCAIGIGRTISVFADGIQLLPDKQHRWTDALQAIVQHAGPATYVYGSEWSIEPPRQEMLGEIPGISVDHIQATSVVAIDFAHWSTWAEYYRSLSSNVRRNVSKAVKRYKTIKIVEGPSISNGRNFLRAIAMRRDLFRRKGIRRSIAVMIVRSLARMLSTSRFTQVAYLIADETLHAFYLGITYGVNTFYLEGAALENNQGTSWYLLMMMIERAYQQSGGKGKFIMGSDDGEQAETGAWQGLRRSRQQCNAQSFPTSVVRFTYAGGGATGTEIRVADLVRQPQRAASGGMKASTPTR